MSAPTARRVIRPYSREHAAAVHVLAAPCIWRRAAVYVGDRGQVDWPALEHAAGPWSSGERLLVQVAEDLYCGAEVPASLDYTGAAGRLPADARVQVSRLRHAVKLATRPAAVSPAVPALEPARVGSAGEVAALVGRWAAAQPWAQLDPGPVGWVYLLCFRDPATGEHRPLCGNGPGGQYAGHYWGWTTDLVRRVEREHRNPAWRGKGRLVRV